MSKQRTACRGTLGSMLGSRRIALFFFVLQPCSTNFITFSINPSVKDTRKDIFVTLERPDDSGTLAPSSAQLFRTIRICMSRTILT